MNQRQERHLLTLGENIKMARKLRQLTQSELASRANKGRQVVFNLEKGIPVKTDSLLDILWALGLEQSLINSISLENDPVGLTLAKTRQPKSIKNKLIKDETGEF